MAVLYLNIYADIQWDVLNGKLSAGFAKLKMCYGISIQHWFIVIVGEVGWKTDPKLLITSHLA